MIPWIIKYAPRTTREIVNQEQAIQKMKEFLYKFKTSQKKGMLLYGSPGVGKTASVRALANELGYELIELNASDERSATRIKEIVGNASKFGSIFGRKRIILIDEVDGMAGFQDRGGVSQLAKIIPKSLVPIFLTANDPWDKKLYPLRQVCEMVEFKSLTNTQIIQRLREIAAKEGIQVDYAVLKALAIRSKGDLRAAINDLQTISIGKKRVTMDDLKILGYRDKEINVFEALRYLFKAKSIKSASMVTMNLDMDPDEFILWVEENIPREYEDIEEIAKAYYYVSRADQFRGRTIKTGNWRLLYVYAMFFVTAGVSSAKKQVYRKWTPYKRPEKLRKLREMYDKLQVLRESVKRLSKHLHESSRNIMQIYVPYLRFMFKKHKDWLKEFLKKYELSERFEEVILGI